MIRTLKQTGSTNLDEFLVFFLNKDNSEQQVVNLDLDQFQEQTVLFKKEFRDKHPDFENRFKWLEEKLTEQIEVIEEQNYLGKSTIPDLNFHRGSLMDNFHGFIQK